MIRSVVYLLTVQFFILLHPCTGQIIDGEPPDFYDLKNCFPKKKEIQKLKIKEIILQIPSKNAWDTMRYNFQSGLIESEVYYHQENETISTLSGKKEYYYTNGILDSIISQRFYWNSSEKGYTLREHSVEISQYDSLNRLILLNHDIKYNYIDSGNVTYIIKQKLGWKKDPFPVCAPVSKFEKFGIDTTKIIYDNKQRIIRYESSNNNFYKTYAYQNDKIIIDEYHRLYDGENYKKVECAMTYKNGLLIKHFCKEKTREGNFGSNGKFKTRTIYVYKNGLINKFTCTSTVLGVGKRLLLDVFFVTINMQ